jgi:hypothetical protein
MSKPKDPTRDFDASHCSSALLFRKKRKPSVVKQLSNKFGGSWKYDGMRWNCDDGRWAARTCSCFPDDSDCRCAGRIYVYGNESPVALD